ncbi:MAG TPA: hypothetical protein VGC86_18200 [Afipia sp.]
MTHRLSIAICASILLIASAAAQTVSPLSPSPEVATRTFQGGSQQRPEGQVRVQSTISYFVSGPSGDSEEGQKLRERARRVIYETAGRECDLLKDTLAKECRLESVNSNINRQFGQGQQEGFSVNGSMSFQIILK